MSSNDTSLQAGGEHFSILTKQDIFFFQVIFMLVLFTSFILFGVASNIINFIVFLKIGFKDTINLSLFALAISDMLSCLTMAPCVLASNPFIGKADAPVNWEHVAHIVGAWPHVAFTKITTLITAFITVERCLCVFKPLKVKAIITRKRVVIYLTSSYAFVLILLACLCYSNQLGWVSSPAHNNRSILGLAFPEEREDIEKVVIPIINAFISLFAFVFIIISTLVLVITLKKTAQWRIGVTTSAAGATATTGVVHKDACAKHAKHENPPSSTEEENGQHRHQNHHRNVVMATTKEQRISRMVVMISSLFIASLFPSVVSLLLLWSDRRFDWGGPLMDLFVIIASCTYFLETVNASMNIFIYYHNSSNYKAMFDQIFLEGWRRKNKAKL